jgi:hypothetical protein
VDEWISQSRKQKRCFIGQLITNGETEGGTVEGNIFLGCERLK